MKRFVLGVVDRFATASELMSFLWTNKQWWLIPLVVALLFLAVLVVFGQATGLGPFIYALF